MSSQFGGFFTGDTAHNRTLDAVKVVATPAVSFPSGVTVWDTLKAPDEVSADADGTP